MGAWLCGCCLLVVITRTTTKLPCHVTPPRRVPAGPLTTSSSFNADSYRYHDYRHGRARCEKKGGSECRSEEVVKEDEDDLENIKCVEIMSDTEKLKQWDKTDYNN